MGLLDSWALPISGMTQPSASEARPQEELKNAREAAVGSRAAQLTPVLRQVKTRICSCFLRGRHRRPPRRADRACCSTEDQGFSAGIEPTELAAGILGIWASSSCLRCQLPFENVRSAHSSGGRPIACRHSVRYRRSHLRKRHHTRDVSAPYQRRTRNCTARGKSWRANSRPCQDHRCRSAGA
jgi:hypothetical protein